MRPLLADAVVIAIIGAAATWSAAVSSRASSRDQARVSLLDVTVSRLAERVAALERSLAAAEAARDAAVESERLAEGQLWAWRAYAAALLAWGRRVSGMVEHGPTPDPPAPPEDSPTN